MTRCCRTEGLLLFAGTVWTVKKVGAILTAAKNGMHIPLITDGRQLNRAFNETIGIKNPHVGGLLVGSFTAVTIVSLANASTTDIIRLRESGMAVLKIINTVGTSDALELTNDAFHEYLDLTFRLAEIGSLVNHTWQPPQTQLPEELDLKSMAVSVMDQIEALTKKLSEMRIVIGSDKNEEPSASGVAPALTPKQSALNLEFLKDIQACG